MRYIVTVRGRLKDADERRSQAVHDATVEKLSPAGRSLGSTGHRAFLNSNDRRQFLGVDQWDSLEGLQRFMSDPDTPAEIGRLFDGQPEVTVWVESGWSGY